MGLNLGSEPSEENCQENASGLTFQEPGQYVRVKSNRLRKRAHRACRKFSLHVAEIGHVLMVGPDYEQEDRTLQPMSSLL